jgi:hypothetical protein
VRREADEHGEPEPEANAPRRPGPALVGRRRVLSIGALAGGLATVAVACSNDRKGTDNGAGGAAPGPTATTAANGDLDVAALAAGLEKLVTDTYTAVGTMAMQGRLGALIPGAVAEFVDTARNQHQAHMDAWNKLLTGAGRQAVREPDAQLKPAVDAAAAKLVDVPGAATLALRLEDYACQTYLKVLPALTSPDVIKLAARILVVDHQHQAILRYVLGLVPVGSGLGRDTRDFAPSDPRASLVTG